MSIKPPNHYATLGVQRGCTEEQVRIAYRVLARKHHPDLNDSSPEAMARTQALNAAYEILGDAARRRAYDDELAAAEKQPQRKCPAGASATIKQDVLLTMQELFRGTTLNVRVNDPANPGGAEIYELTIPPETAPGARFRIKRTGGAVAVRVKVRPDFRFKARGSDLRCDLRINTQRATQGGSENVRGPTGNSLRVQIPPNVSRNEIIRIPGEGLPKPRGGRGDLLVRITYRPEVRITRAS